MKPIWKIILLATLLVGVANLVLTLKKAPETSNVVSATPLTSEYVEDVSYRVPYEYARQCIDNYAKLVSASNSKMVQSFTINRQDFLQTIKIKSESPISSRYEYARGYIGLDVITNQFHIFFTPVEGVKTNEAGNIIDAGRDVILRGKYQTKDRFSGHPITSSNGDDEGAYMLDLNAPCPETCGSLPPPDEVANKVETKKN